MGKQKLILAHGLRHLDSGSPLPRYSGGEGLGVRGPDALRIVADSAPHPRPLSPEYRGEGSKEF